MFLVNNSTKDLSDAHLDTAILSVGATEQCGPYLPMNINTLVAEYYARAWREVLGAYVLPTLPFNTSEEHASFKGTVSLSPSTMMLVLEEVVEGLRAQDFRKQVLTVGHGGALWVGAFVKRGRFAPDGSWGRYEPEADSAAATAEAGRVLLEHFVKEQGAKLKEHLREACHLKGI